MRLGLAVLDFDSRMDTAPELAPATEALGYSRYWIAEHPPQPNPVLLMALAAGLTRKIRVGAGAICLTFRNPLQTAQDLLLLERLFPGRIDAGFCRGGASREASNALLEGRALASEQARFGEKAVELVTRLREHRRPPEIWSMGTGPASASLAAEQGTAFAYSLFHHGSVDTDQHCAAYRRAFRPHARGEKPCVALAVAGVCADREAKVKQLIREHDNRFIVPTLHGTVSQCAEALGALRERYRMDEVVFLDISKRYRDKLRSYELLARAAREA